MGREIIYFIVIFLLSVGMVPAAEFQYTSCFPPEGYYDFQNGVDFYDFHVDKVSYHPGDRVIVSYDLTSRMKAPVVQARVRVQIFYNDPDKGEQIIDEFFIPKEYNLMEADSVPQEYFWYVPQGARSGAYTVKTYLIVGDSFNLGGLSFLPYGPPGAPAKMTSFEVVNTEQESSIYFDRDNTLVNGQTYPFLGLTLIFTTDNSITFETQLVNHGPVKDVQLSMKTYVWDDTTDKNLINTLTRTQTIHLSESGSEKISYPLGKLGTNAYEVVFEAKSGEEKSILKLRFSVGGEKARFIYFGIDKFPLTQEKTTVFVCFSNSADYTSFPSGKIRFEIRDKTGNVIWSDEADVDIPPNPTGGKFEFTPQGSYRYLTFKGMIFDKENNVVDEQILVYDYTKFSNIERNFEITIDKDSYNTGDTLTYRVSYTDNFNDPLDGEVVVYLLDPNDKIAYTYTSSIHGSLSNKVKLPNSVGTYTLKAVEKGIDLKTEKTVEVKAGTKFSPLLILVAAVIIVLGFVTYKQYSKR